MFRNNGLKEHFSTFVMSCMLGVIKPHELMFSTALKELNIKPGEALFIDDSVKNLDGARSLGIQTVLMLRDKNSDVNRNEHKCINNLMGLEKLLGISK